MELSTLFMGVIAVAVLALAVTQVATLLYGLRVVRRLDRMADQVEKDIMPVIDRVNAISGDITRATSLAVAQIERADQLFARFAVRAERLMTVGEDAVMEPVRRSAAIIQALRAALESLRRNPGKAAEKAPADEEQEALFIG
ncbi:MAG: hypothetical protein F4057_12510 [Acidobacteria bacterium]|nr:hypothetical protein [Acidobacteriota bacterium]